MGASTSREPASLPGEFREKTSTSAAADATELDVLYRNLPSYQPRPTGEFKVTEKTMATEPITLPTELVDETTVVSLIPPVLTTTGLRIITSPSSPTLIVDLALPEVVTSPTSIVAGVLVSMKTPSRSPAISHFLQLVFLPFPPPL